MRLLRGDDRSRRPIHRHRLVKDLLDRARQTRFHSHPRQSSGDDRLLRAQMFLLLRQISQQQTHHQQVDRQHE